MTLFEYIAVASSIVISFTVIRLLDALPVASVTGRRDPIHLGWLIWLLWACATLWWASWSYRGVEWNYPKFLLFLSAPALLFGMVRTLTSTDGASVSSWQEHFERVRRRFFTLFCLYYLALALMTWLILGMPLLHWFRIIQVALIGVGLLGAGSESRRVQAAVLAVSLVALGFATVFGLVRPEPLLSLPGS